MTASHCDRCGKTASLQPVTVLGDYHGRGMWSQWIEQLCQGCAKEAEAENERKEKREGTVNEHTDT